jgi:threonine aldolase
MSFEDGSIDLQSDTVTRPTPAMREAMARAEVGDDVYGNDPTVNRLQVMAAERTGHEAALFMASGTMANLVALLTHGERGAEVIIGSQSHVYLWEVGGMAALGGLHVRTVPNQPDGTLRLEDIGSAIRPDDIHCPRTRLICLENTQCACGGVPLTAEYTRRVSALARARGLRLHLDGARLFNAAVAQGVEARDLASPADSVMFCLSKGLCAPVGSMLCGSRAFIEEARRYRKQVGGAMRQVGVLAAAGIVALESMVDRLAEDHAHARALAEGLRAVPGLVLDGEPPPTNLVYFSLAPRVKITDAAFVDRLRERGVLVLPEDPRRFRLVTHAWISPADISRAVGAIRDVLALEEERA